MKGVLIVFNALVSVLADIDTAGTAADALTYIFGSDLYTSVVTAVTAVGGLAIGMLGIKLIVGGNDPRTVQTCRRWMLSILIGIVLLNILKPVVLNIAGAIVS